MKTIAIPAETYDELVKQKAGDETVADVLARLIGKRKELAHFGAFFGRWRDLPNEYFEIMEKAHHEIRAEFNRSFPI